MSNTEENGFVYILTNEQSFKDSELVKIGMSDRTVEDRIREFSTAAPFPYRKVASIHTSNAKLLEEAVHDIITCIAPGCRVNDSREFFKISPLRAAFVVQKIALLLGEKETVRYFDVYGKGQIIYRCTLSGADAFGYDDGEKFIVLKGSRIGREADSLVTYRAAISNLRKDLENTNVIEGKIFTNDYVFDSPSIAATTVMGRPNGSACDWISIAGEPHS